MKKSHQHSLPMMEIQPCQADTGHIQSNLQHLAQTGRVFFDPEAEWGQRSNRKQSAKVMITAVRPVQLWKASSLMLVTLSRMVACVVFGWTGFVQQHTRTSK